jgi:phage terminase large subunit-like protein
VAKDSFDLNDVLLRLGEGLQESVHAPNLYNYKPSEKQQLFHEMQNKARLYIGGNRSGKSVGSTLEGIYYVTHSHPWRKTPEGPVRGRVVAVDFLNGVDKIILPLWKQWLPKKYLINGSWEDSYSRERHVLTLNNGSFVEFMSQDQDLDKFAGSSRHFVHFDEECPKTVWQECLARLVDTDGDWWMSQTPVQGMEWIFDDVFIPAKEGTKDIGIVEASMEDNPTLSKEAIARYMEALTPEERLIRKNGQYVHLGGSVFPEFSPLTHCIPKGQFKPTSKHRIIRTMDSGYTNPTVWLWMAVDEHGTIIVFKEHYQDKWNVAQHAEVVNKETRQIVRDSGAEVYLTTGDPAIKQTKEHTGTSILQEYAKHGIYIAVDQIPSDRRVGLERIQQYMKVNPKTNKPWLMFTDDCAHLIAELPKLKWKKHASPKIAEQKNKLEDIRDKDNHCYDALKYAMTFMADLTPEAQFSEGKREEFHNIFRTEFNATRPASDYDEGDGWGNQWRGNSSTLELEG